MRSLHVSPRGTFIILSSSLDRTFLINLKNTKFLEEGTEDAELMSDEEHNDELQLTHPIIDCSFSFNEERIVCLCASFESPLLIYDLKGRQPLISFSRSELNLHPKEYICYISEAIDNDLLCTSNRGNTMTFAALDSVYI